MYFRLMGKLNARRKALLQGEEAEKGFTLIELLVVVIIIGILAAIAIPIYIGIQNNAKDSAVKSDLTNMKTAVVSYYSQNGGSAFPTLDQTTLKSYGYTSSASYTTPPAAASGSTSTSFCISGVSITGTTFSITSSSGVIEAVCPASTSW